ncbi:LuxR C-terminal-related transcriptional regulator [Maribacter chungangensis]|uniref:LuxR C-terminal-related transcriptional regulator n=1 Tax=Maribacter chungangensis TaxID=1069117 RepID=A0ABW3B587_9FLAO
MFGTSLHWTTFFYTLINTILVILALIQSKRLDHTNINRYLILGLLFVCYNLTGGLLPVNDFPGPFISQYIITYGVAIAMCVYVVKYLYNEYDIVVLKLRLTVANIAYYVIACFVLLFLLPYYFNDSIDLSRIYFSVPVSAICLYICWAFFKKISNPDKPYPFVLRRNKFSLISITCIGLLPILTVIGDYQWLTFTVINIAFYCITFMEIDRYLYFLENKGKMQEVFNYYENLKGTSVASNLHKNGLSRREMEVAMSILENKNYKQIAKDLFIAESTVSKHASNIFKKTEVKNRKSFLQRYSIILSSSQ